MPDVAGPVRRALLAVVLVDEVLAQVRRVDDLAGVQLPRGSGHRQGAVERADAARAGPAPAVVHDVCAWWVVVWVSVEGVGYLWDDGAGGRLFGGVVRLVVLVGDGGGLVLLVKPFDVIPFA